MVKFYLWGAGSRHSKMDLRFVLSMDLSPGSDQGRSDWKPEKSWISGSLVHWERGLCHWDCLEDIFYLSQVLGLKLKKFKICPSKLTM